MKNSDWDEKKDSQNDDYYSFEDILVTLDSETVGDYSIGENIEAPEIVDLDYNLKSDPTEPDDVLYEPEE